ncbi:MAG: 5'/3'-nucleotidase SurE [Bacteroidales bacterium]|nr:5'/3'-nucleotidase SurE [Bacteroidales bacterium]
MSKPLILVTNDDGITAPGIRKLIELMRKLGKVVVVAPEDPQSAMSHAITIKCPLVYKEIEITEDYKEYSLNGTPVDCVKFGLHRLLERKPDLIVSGINHGSNASINIIYSGTMGAALEGAMGEIPAIGFSILDYNHDADFSRSEEYILKIAKQVLEQGLDKGIALNVNFPKLVADNDYKGLKICRQSKAYWKEDFAERNDPRNGKPYFWLTGTFTVNENDESTDEWALENYYVSIVPVQFDFTAYQQIEKLKNWE